MQTQPLAQWKPAAVASKSTGIPRPGPLVMRPITLKKILPRNRQTKEAAVTPRRSPRISLKEDKENIPLAVAPSGSPGGSATKPERERSPPQRSLDAEPGVPPRGAVALFPAGPGTHASLPDDERDLAMAKRVRRSYSRSEASLSQSFQERLGSPGSGLSDSSTPNHAPGKRQTLFGFEKLLIPGVLASMSPVNASVTQKSPTGATEPGPLHEPDTDIPGISFVKEKRRKKKVPQFDKSELDEWAAQMNAEFEEAERFDLLVE
ncbi:sororin [Varanus komodoensis]|uniref:Cell division cycle associated 5 n=1 Tax=Varanus komodoensis TaxID=61221 RepID=A0A8D2LB93_VARKO|nr:sororin [Varanus komodoensis]